MISFHCLFSSSHIYILTFSISSLEFFISEAIFLHSSPSLSMSILRNPPSQFHPSFPSFPLNFLNTCSLCQLFISYTFGMTSPCQTTPPQFILKTFRGDVRRFKRTRRIDNQPLSCSDIITSEPNKVFHGPSEKNANSRSNSTSGFNDPAVFDDTYVTRLVGPL